MIIAVDFDGVLCEDNFPAIGPPKLEHIELIKYLINRGHEVILWTSRVEKELDAAKRWCKRMGLEFAAVNDNAPSNKKQYADMYSTAPRKIYADMYIDDHSVDYDDATLEYKVMERLYNGRMQLWQRVK